MANRTCDVCDEALPEEAPRRGRPRLRHEGCFPSASTGRKRRYSSLTEWDCANCGKHCTRPPTKGQTPKFCSERCCQDNKKDGHCCDCGEVIWRGQTRCRPCDNIQRHASCRLPRDHPVRILIRQAKAAPKEPRYQWRTERRCPGCACRFTPIYTPNMLACSLRCSRRIHRWRRKAREVEATGEFTYSELMHIARRFGYSCAYCGEKSGALEPDHVVPLSRGGSNSTTNLLPSCRQCNGHKRDLLLDEWAEYREQKGLQPRATSWDASDRRYWHLTSVSVAA